MVFISGSNGQHFTFLRKRNFVVLYTAILHSFCAYEILQLTNLIQRLKVKPFFPSTVFYSTPVIRVNNRTHLKKKSTEDLKKPQPIKKKIMLSSSPLQINIFPYFEQELLLSFHLFKKIINMPLIKHFYSLSSSRVQTFL